MRNYSLDNYKFWPLSIKHLIAYFHDEEGYFFSFIADVITRETGRKCTKNSAVGMYNRFKRTNQPIDYAKIADYLPNSHGYHRTKRKVYPNSLDIQQQVSEQAI